MADLPERGVRVRWFSRAKRRGGRPREADDHDLLRLTEFVTTRPGVEAYLEPRTAVTAHTVVLVAGTGEWTRRRVAGPEAASKFAATHGIPLYETHLMGYPQRMRDWTAAQKKQSASE
jgi:hypothetical protein